MQVALSAKEVEYISLSLSLREVIPGIIFFNEMKKNNISSLRAVSTVYCKAFEKNTGALELAKNSRMRPRIKRINLVCHNFREHLRIRVIRLF